LFGTGMSVEEVRSRLASDFAFIDENAPQKGGQRSGKGEVSPELSLGVSNMAKSMVAMTQQQGTIIKRIQGIEALLGELGIKGSDAVCVKNAPVAQQQENGIEQRLDHLDRVTQGLADSVAALAEELGSFLGSRAKLAEEWRNAAAGAPVPSPESPSSSHSRIIPLRPQPGKEEARFRAREENPPSEPPRHFFSLPMVVRTAQGQYLSADGRPRSRFCLNDLKAMLVHGFTPPAHFVLQWEPHGQGWRLELTQPKLENPRGIRLLLMEVPGRPEGNVVEILQLQENGQAVHPTAMPRLLASLSA
jgi:hypothetical protein